MKLLFIHNTIPEYRIEFMKKISKLIDIKFLITNKLLQDKIYGVKVSEKIEGINIEYLPKKKKSKFIKIKNEIVESGIDAIVLPPADNLSQYLHGVIALLYGKKYNKEIIYWCEKWEAKFSKQPLKKKVKNIIHRLMIMSLAKNSDICIAAGSKSKEYLKMIGVNNSRIKIAFDSSSSPEVIENFDLRSKYNIPKDAKLVLYFGRIIKRKGCEILIRSFNQISNEIENVYLIICGDGEYMDKCKGISKEINLNNVVFAGKINPEVRKIYYSQSNVFVLPSFSLDGTVEAWGLTVNEAMECGIPVVATTAVGSAYDIISPENGIIIEENDIIQLKDAIVKILKNIDNIDYKKNCIFTAKKYSVNEMANSFGQAILCLKN